MITTIIPNWPAPSNVHAYTTTRHLALPSSRDGGDHEALEKNRQRLPVTLNLPTSPIWLHQVHGDDIIALSNDIANATREFTADGAYTHDANIICTVATADCLPVLLCNRQGNKVAAIHAGWRGLAAGIIYKAAKLLSPTDDKAENELLAWLGPAIGPQSFEVGPEVREQFLQLDPNTAPAFHSNIHSKFKASPNDRWLADIYRLAKLQLAQAGVTTVYGGQYCTYTQRDLLLSYRRGDAGNMASLIWFD